jgi:hypothetical protein
MATLRLEKAAWQRYFEQISNTLLGKRAEIEVASLKLGDQLAAEWVPLLGIAYDTNNDLVDIKLEGRDHMIRRPREIYVDFGPAGLSSLEVIDADDARHIVKLREPLMLPPPDAA